MLTCKLVPLTFNDYLTDFGLSDTLIIFKSLKLAYFITSELIFMHSSLNSWYYYINKNYDLSVLSTRKL